MTLLRTPRSGLVLVAAASLACLLTGAAVAQEFRSSLPAEPAASSVVRHEGVLYRELTRGIYEAVLNPRDSLLYVASSLAIPGVSGGVIYKLDPATLDVVGAIHTDRRNFALALNADGSRLFTTNATDHSLTAIDTAEGSVVARLDFDEKGVDGYKYGPRQVIFDAARNALYVGAVGNPGVIWVVDPETLQLRHTITNAGKWVTGLLVHPTTGDLYAANGDGEVLVIDTGSYAIKHRFKPAGEQEALLLNLAIDPQSNRLYVTDHSKLKTTLILDAATGEKVGELPEGGDAMGIRFNPVRREIYVTHRDQGTVSIWNADTLQRIRIIRAQPNPNSLALSPDSQTLFITIKTPFTDSYSASGVESVARVQLDAPVPAPARH